MKIMIFDKNFIKIMFFVKPRIVMYFVGMLGMTLTWGGLSIFQSVTLKNIINATVENNQELFVHSFVIFAVCFTVFLLLTPHLRWWYNANAKRSFYDIQTAMFEHIQALPMEYFEKTHSGDIVSRMTNDVTTLAAIYGGKLRRFCAPAVLAALYAVAMVVLDWRVGAVLIVYNLAFASINIFFSTPIRNMSNRVQKGFGAITEKAIDILSGFSVIKMFHLEPLMFDSFDKHNHDVTIHSIQRARVEGMLGGANYVLRMISSVGVISGGVILLISGITDLGTLLALISLQASFNWTLLDASQNLPMLQEAFAGAERVFQLLDQGKETRADGREKCLVDTGNTASLLNGFSSLKMQNVTFSYEEERPVLRDCSLCFEKDKVTALVGPSGSGKTTLLKLLLGFHVPQGGTIAINDTPVTDTVLELRRHMAYVQQENYLFNGTIEENIAYGKHNATKDEIVHSARLAYAHDFIIEQPDGYATRIGERGVKLSGGQKQRIAIARAIVKNAPLLLLDEATSALDSESEALIQQALNSLMKDRTTIVVAHRLSTVKHADHIYVIDRGRVVEEGTHDSLVNNNGLYSLLYELQFAI